MTEVWLSRRALLDVDAIDQYSTERWGRRTANRYLEDLHGALDRLKQAPSLLARRDELSLRLSFYRVREHLLICDVIDEDVYVLAVRHTAMDLPRRIAELEPVLRQEVQMLHETVVAKRRE